MTTKKVKKDRDTSEQQLGITDFKEFSRLALELSENVPHTAEEMANAIYGYPIRVYYKVKEYIEKQEPELFDNQIELEVFAENLVNVMMSQLTYNNLSQFIKDTKQRQQ